VSPDALRILFACVHNAGRSQMAAALFNRHADPARAHALSAGTRPAARVHPEVEDALREVGIEIGGHTPRLLTPELAANQCTPAFLGETAQDLGRRHGFTVTVLDRAAIQKEGMGALIAAGGGRARLTRSVARRPR